MPGSIGTIMRGCMETDKPLISIVLAVYNPRLDWLREQLESLNAQTYPNLELLVRDDCSPEVPYADICALIYECITKFPYAVSRNEQNLGSNGTFERLTEQAHGGYIAYCDQDDIWLPEKLEVLFEAIIFDDTLLACSDMYVIDAKGKQIADSITRVRKRHIFRSGNHLAPGLIYRNFVTGCTMLVRAETAKKAVPFPACMVHDHWVALWSAAHGSIKSLRNRLVYYRLHGDNQTETLAGVCTKEDYYRLRILPFDERVKMIDRRLSLPEAKRALLWARARVDNYTGKPGAAKKLRDININPTTTAFELTLLKAPQPFFRMAVRMIRKGVL